MDISIGEIAHLLKATVVGDATVRIRNVRGVQDAEPGDLTFVIDPKYVTALATTRASAVLIRADISIETAIPQVRVANPREAFATLTQALAPPPIVFAPGVHATAVVAPDAVLGKNVSVQPYAVIEPGVTIGDNTIVGAHAYVGHGSTIGADSRLHPHVVIRERCVLGARVTVHAGTVIGADGFGYEQIGGKNVKIPQIGIVVVEDDVEIGANTTIDRARFDKTIIRRGAKLDNLVQIAHNCEVGEDSVICAQAGLSGSAKVGNHVIMAGQAGMVGHIKIHDNIIIGAQGGVSKTLEKPGFYIGSPATPHMTYKRRESVVVKLPELQRTIHDLQRKIEQLTRRIEQKS